MSVNTGRAVFTIVDWDGLPDDKEWHGLKENKCWPEELAEQDPGWALLAEDEFYQAGQHPLLAANTKSYEGFPDANLLAAKVLQLDPANEVRPLTPAEALVIFGEDGIPLELQGVLPGIPKFSTPKPPKLRRGVFYPRGNITHAPPRVLINLPGMPTLPGSSEDSDSEDFEDLDDDSNLDDLEDLERLADFPGDSGDADLEDLDAQALAQWMENYVKFGKREESRASPSENEAVPTPFGQGAATAVPAIEGSLASAGLPIATTFVY